MWESRLWVKVLPLPALCWHLCEPQAPCQGEGVTTAPGTPPRIAVLLRMRQGEGPSQSQPGGGCPVHTTTSGLGGCRAESSPLPLDRRGRGSPEAVTTSPRRQAAHVPSPPLPPPLSPTLICIKKFGLRQNLVRTTQVQRIQNK